MKDTLLRRLRYAPPQPIGKRIELHKNDFTLFEAIHRHGHLPSHYLHAFSENKSHNALQHRLTKLYNGTTDGAYLIRPPQQFDSFHARYQPIVYDLNEHSKQLLSEQGKLSPFIHRTDPFLHRLMSACVGASIELACKSIRYISRHDILSRKGSPMALPLAMPNQRALVPDDLIGFDYGGHYRFLAVEIDRNTESTERKDKSQNSFSKKLAAYLEVMRNRTYKDIWGIPNLMVLTVTTNVTHMHNLMKHVHQLDPKLSERFIFKALPTFGAHWRVPPVLKDILDPWHQPNDRMFDLTK